jgi:ribosome-binding factor A
VSQRIERVDALLRQEIGKILAREVQDPGVGFVTVTDVEASPDLGHARVWVSVIGSADEQRGALRALERAMPFVRRQLGARLRLKRIPDLHVHLDDSMSRGTRVLQILDGLERGETPDGGPAEAQLPKPVARLPREGDAVEAPEEPGERAAGGGTRHGPVRHAGRPSRATGRGAADGRARAGHGRRR